MKPPTAAPAGDVDPGNGYGEPPPSTEKRLMPTDEIRHRDEVRAIRHPRSVLPEDYAPKAGIVQLANAVADLVRRERAERALEKWPEPKPIPPIEPERRGRTPT